MHRKFLFFIVCFFSVGITVHANETLTYIGQLSSLQGQSITLGGDYAYIVDYFVGLSIVDIHEPYSPKLIGQFEAAGFRQLALDGDYAYIAAGDMGLRILDIHIPGAIQDLGFYQTSGTAYAVAIQDHFAYIAAGEIGGLRKVDIREPTALKEVAFYAGSTWIRPGPYPMVCASFKATSIVIQDHYAYVVADAVCTSNFLAVFDISQDSSLQLVGMYSPAQNVSANAVAVQGDVAYYLKSMPSKITFIDIHEKNLPVQINTCDTLGEALSAAVNDRYIFIADGSHGLWVNPLNTPEELCASAYYYTTQGYVQAVVTAGAYVYLLDRDKGLLVLRIGTIKGSSCSHEQTSTGEPLFLLGIIFFLWCKQDRKRLPTAT